MTDYRAIVDRLVGPLVPVMPALDDQQRVDIDATCKWVEWLIQRGIKMLWTTAGTSHFMSLTDNEIVDLTSAVAGVTQGRAIFIASTAYHWPAGKCIDFLDFAAECGVDIVKLQVDWHWNPDENLVFDHYQRIAEASPLPLFAYTLGVPGVSTGITNRLLARILQLPQFVGMKNDSGDFYEHTQYQRTIRSHGGKFVVMTGGTMESFLHGRLFGNRAFTSGLGMIAPELPSQFADHLECGRQDKAVAIVRDYELPILTSFAAMGHWSCYHTALWLAGRFPSHRVRFPLRTLEAPEIETVKNMLHEKGMLEL